MQPWLCPAAGWLGPGAGCKQISPRSESFVGPEAGRRGQAWWSGHWGGLGGGQLIILVSILGCDNTKHPLGLVRHCLVNLFFWRWEKTRGHPESERRCKLWAGAGSPTWLSGEGHLCLAWSSEEALRLGREMGRISRVPTMTHPGNPSSDTGWACACPELQAHQTRASH